MLLGKLELSEFLSSSHHVLVLDTHDWGRGSVDDLSALHVLGSEVLLESGEVLHIDLVDLSEGDAGSGLGVNELTEGSLVLDDAVWNVLGSAESGQESHHFDWLDIVGDDDELGFTFFNEGGHVVQTVLKNDWLGADVLGLVATLSGLSLGLESLLLGDLGLWLVSVQELEELSRLVLVEDVGEHVEGSGLLKSHHQDTLLSLDSDVLGPLDESGEVAGWLDVTTDSEVSGVLLEQRVGALGFGSLGCDDGSS